MVPPFYILSWKIWRSQILCHSIDLYAFYMIHQPFSHIFKISSNSRGGPNFLERTNSAEQLNIWSPFCISILRIWRTQILGHSLDFQEFYMIQQPFSRIFKISSNLGGGTYFLWGNQFCRTVELFGPPFCISLLRILWNQILRHSLYFNQFYIIQQFPSHIFKISSNSTGGPNFLVVTNSAEQLNYLVPPPLLYFNFQNSKDPNSVSFIRF